MAHDGNASGFLPDASGPEGARFGRDPVTGRAFKSDGTVRKARASLTPTERLAALQQAQERAHASVGRSVAATIPAFAAVVTNAGTVRRYAREARAYATPEARAERAAYFQRMLEAVAAKGRAAQAWLTENADAAEAVADLYAALGEAVAQLGRTPTEAEARRLLAEVVPADTLRLLQQASDPARDPFAAFRRDAADPDTGSDD